MLESGGETSDEIVTHHLATQYTLVQGRHQLEIIRPLGLDEQEAATKSSALIWWLTVRSRWNPIIEAWGRLDPELRSANPAQLTLLDRRSFDLLKGLRDFDRQVRQTDRYTPNASQFLDFCNKAGWDAVASHLKLVPESPQATIEIEEHQIKPGQIRNMPVLTSFAAEWLGLKPTPAPPAYAWLQAAVSLATHVHTQLLALLAGDIEAAARIINSLASEIVLGEAVLVTGVENANPAHGEEFKPSIQRLGAEHIQPLMHAVRIAQEQVRQAPVPASSAPEQTSPVQPQISSDVLSTSPPPPTESSEPPAPSHRSEWSPTDVTLLVTETIELSEQLERLWSDALARSISDPAIEAELSRWRSLIAAVTDPLAGDVGQTGIYSFPPSVDDVLALPSRSPLERGLVAHVHVVSMLTNSVVAFGAPALVADLKRGTLAHYWNSGGLSQLRDASRTALRNLRELGQVDEPNVPRIELGRHQDDAMESLAIAQRCLEVGAAEAALGYAQRAWTIAKSRRIPGELDKRHDETVSSLETLEPLVREVSERFARGEAVTLSDTLPLASLFVAILGTHIGPQLRVEIRPSDE